MPPSESQSPDRKPAAPEKLDEKADFARRLAFLELGPQEATRLREIGRTMAENQHALVERFYRHLMSFEATASFLRDPALVTRLKESQRKHFESLFEADWSENYSRQRRRVGEVHAEVGIEPQWFLGAYNQYLQYGLEALLDSPDPEVQRSAAEAQAFVKAALLDIGLTLDAYFARLTENLRRALDMYWRANDELKQFARLASHDLKTPLATVANLCDEAIDEFGGEMPEGAKQLIRAAEQRTLKMSQMIDELLSFSVGPRGSEGCDEFPPMDALAEAVERIRPQIEKGRIELILPPSIPYVWGNRIRLREAFYNLLSNAIKFLDKPRGRIEVSFRIDETHCIFCITDNGSGIPREEWERIFVPFRRLAGHRDRPGHGLGLYFTKTLIEEQQGRIWVESEVGEGSRFYISLWRHQQS